MGVRKMYKKRQVELLETILRGALYAKETSKTRGAVCVRMPLIGMGAFLKATDDKDACLGMFKEALQDFRLPEGVEFSICDFNGDLKKGAGITMPAGMQIQKNLFCTDEYEENQVVCFVNAWDNRSFIGNGMLVDESVDGFFVANAFNKYPEFINSSYLHNPFFHGYFDAKSTWVKTTSVLLVLTGALNPVHNGHLKMLEDARNRLVEEEGFRPTEIRAVLSPSHDNYVKTKHGHISIDHRLQMVRLAIASRKYSWVQAGTWEGKNVPLDGAYHDFPAVVDHYKQKHAAVRVVYVAGQDHYVAHVNGTDLDAMQLPRNIDQGLSSTQVRAMKDFRAIKEAVPQKVAEYILNNKLYSLGKNTLAVASFNVAGNVQSLTPNSNTSEDITVLRMLKANAPKHGKYAALFMKKLGVDLLGVQEMVYGNLHTFNGFLNGGVQGKYHAHCQQWTTRWNGSACLWNSNTFSRYETLNIDENEAHEQVRSASAVYFPDEKLLFISAWLGHEEGKKIEALESLGHGLNGAVKGKNVGRIILTMDSNDERGEELGKRDITLTILEKTLGLHGDLCNSCCEDYNFQWVGDFIFDSCKSSEVLTYGIPDLPSRSELDPKYSAEKIQWTRSTQLMSDHLPILMVSNL